MILSSSTTGSDCICAYCFRPVHFKSASIDRNTGVYSRIQHFAHAVVGDKNFCPYECAESLEHVSFKRQRLASLISANLEYTKINGFAPQVEQSVKIVGKSKKRGRRADILTRVNDKPIFAVEIETSRKEIANIESRILDYHASAIANDWTATDEVTDSDMKPILSYGTHYLKLQTTYAKVTKIDERTGFRYFDEDKSQIERQHAIVYTPYVRNQIGKQTAQDLTLEVEAENIERLIKAQENLTNNQEEWVKRRNEFSNKKVSPEEQQQQLKFPPGCEFPLKEFIEAYPDIMHYPRQKVRVYETDGFMTSINFDSRSVIWMEYGSDRVKEAAIDEVVVIDPYFHAVEEFKSLATEDQQKQYRDNFLQQKEHIEQVAQQQYQQQNEQIQASATIDGVIQTIKPGRLIEIRKQLGSSFDERCKELIGRAAAIKGMSNMVLYSGTIQQIDIKSDMAYLQTTNHGIKKDYIQNLHIN
ncbi:MAG: hypothetical protein WBA41_16830 [Rivularia sp. (in: cyanobacteria)]